MVYSKLKEFFKKYPNFYSFIMYFFSPVYPFGEKKMIKKFSQLYPHGNIINIGAGPSKASKGWINIDIEKYPGVKIVGDVQSLPLKSNSIKKIYCVALLEHVPELQKSIKEMNRVLVKEGLLLCYIPFICGFHAAPNDYWRVTIEGVKQLFKDWEIIEIIPFAPTSGFLWIFQEWLAITFSFGSKILKDILYIILLLTTWPIKYLDFFLNFHPCAHYICSGFWIFARKR